jgi:hypothetical protein
MDNMREKDPDAVLDFPFIWSDWLADVSNDTINTYSVSVESGLTLDSSSVNTVALTVEGVEYAAYTVVIAWLSGGTVDNTYTVRCRITTNGGRTDDRSIEVYIKER